MHINVKLLVVPWVAVSFTRICTVLSIYVPLNETASLPQKWNMYVPLNETASLLQKWNIYFLIDSSSYVDRFELKPHNSLLSKLILSLYYIAMITLYNVSKPYSNRSIRDLL